jgi:hypothetical protein
MSATCSNTLWIELCKSRYRYYYHANTNTKEQKEDFFVTGHDGTTPWEITWVSLAGPLGVALCQYLCRNIISKSQQVVIEAVVLWFPMILSQSNLLYRWWASGSLVLQGLVQAYFRYVVANNTTKTTKETEESQQQQQQQPKAKQSLDYLTAYRSVVSSMTFVAILAVDFHVFPRRLCQDGNSRLQIDGSGHHLVCHSVWDRHTHKALGKEQLHKYLLHLLPLILIGVIQIITKQQILGISRISFRARRPLEFLFYHGWSWPSFRDASITFHPRGSYRRPSWSRMNSTWSPWDFNVSSNGALDCVTNY